MVWSLAHPHNRAPFGMNQKVWDEKKLSFATFYGYIHEETLRGKRIPNHNNSGRPTIKNIHFDQVGVEYVFANCRHCLRKDFTGSFNTGVDPGVNEYDNNTARLGRCGCVCCTRCVLVSESTNKGWTEWISCPACGSVFQNENEIFWIVGSVG
jgi:hypothetical protein